MCVCLFLAEVSASEVVRSRVFVAFLQISDTPREVGQLRFYLKGASHSAAASKLPLGFNRGAQRRG